MSSFNSLSYPGPRRYRSGNAPSAPFTSLPQQDDRGGIPMFQTQRVGGARYSSPLNPSGFEPQSFDQPSAPQMSGYQYGAPSAPSFDRMLGMANRGQIARGPSPGFASGNIDKAAGLMQFGENARGPQMYNDNRGYQQDANMRLNDLSSARSGLLGSEARYNDQATQGMGQMLPGQVTAQNIQNQGATSMLPYGPKMAESQIGLQGAQQHQMEQMPQDWKAQNATLTKQLHDLQAEHDRVTQQLRLYQQQGGGGAPQDVRKTGGLTQDQYLQNYTKLRETAAKEELDGGRKRTPEELDQYVNGAMGKWDPAHPTTQAAPPPVSTYGAQPQQAQPQQAQANVPTGATPNGDGSITMHGMRYVRDEQNKGWRKAG